MVKNKWRTATILLGILALGLFCFQVYDSQFANYNLDGVKINKANFNQLHDELPQGVYKLCNTDSSKCVKFYQDMLE